MPNTCLAEKQSSTNCWCVGLCPSLVVTLTIMRESAFFVAACSLWKSFSIGLAGLFLMIPYHMAKPSYSNTCLFQWIKVSNSMPWTVYIHEEHNRREKSHVHKSINAKWFSVSLAIRPAAKHETGCTVICLNVGYGRAWGTSGWIVCLALCNNRGQEDSVPQKWNITFGINIIQWSANTKKKPVLRIKCKGPTLTVLNSLEEGI